MLTRTLVREIPEYFHKPQHEIFDNYNLTDSTRQIVKMSIASQKYSSRIFCFFLFPFNWLSTLNKINQVTPMFILSI